MENGQQRMITTYEYGNPEADVVLIQLTGEHELAVLENEVKEIRKRASSGELDFRFIAAKVENWNDELSPWKAPAVFKNEDFGGGAAETLEKILALCTDPGKTYYIGGYSLAGLFALWAAYQTDRFSGVAAASPSVWFPGFSAYMREHRMKTGTVYLSLGDREEKTRNPVMAQVGACIRGYKLYPGMEPGKSFSGTRCENSEGVCVGDGKENRESSKGKAEKMIYIGLVDDECEHLMKMRTFLLQYEEEHNTKFSIQEFHNGLNFVEDYKGDLDIVFLDKLEKAIRFAKWKVEKELVLQTEDRFLAEQDPEL